jgi:type IV secretion system protein VirB1
LRKAVLLFAIGAGAAYCETLSPAAFGALGKTCIPGSDRIVVTSIVRTESAFNPNALSLNYPETLARRAGLPPGRVFLKTQPRTAAQAMLWAADLLRRGMTVSVGLMQINAEQGYSIQRLLDPCENLRAGWSLFSQKYAKSLQRAHDPNRAMRMALSDYNSGSVVVGEENGYVGKVLLGMFGP